MTNNSQQLKYFIYARKSQEAEDRQVQSLDDQLETMTALAERLNLTIIGKPFSEAKSARKPNNRPVFSDMVERLNKGEADGILVWKLNRISRNQLESGIIGQMLEDGIIKSIRTPEREYNPEDNVLIYNVESAMSAQYSKDLSKDVRRGQARRVREGYYPTKAPMGYKNDKNVGEIVKDEKRFDLVRQMWDLALTGRHSQREITDIANNAWGFRTTKHHKSGSTKISYSQMYKMFGNIFYTGTHFMWKSELHSNGRQPQMITLEEFERVQGIFNKSNRPRQSKPRSPYAGLIHCGCGCGCMFTGEVSVRTLKGTQEERAYVHYRSTKRRKGSICVAKRMSLKELDGQISKTLDKLGIQQPFLDWAFECIDKNAGSDVLKQSKVEQMKSNSVEEKEKELKTLRHMRMKDFINDAQFIEDKQKLDKEIVLLKEKEKTNANIEQKRENLKDAVTFLSEAKTLLKDGDIETKSDILRYLNDEHSIVGKKFIMNTHEWMQPFLTSYKMIEARYDRLGMAKEPLNKGSNDDYATTRRLWCGWGESNSRPQFGRLLLYHLTTPACAIYLYSGVAV